MDLVGIINQLRRERDMIDRAIAALSSLQKDKSGDENSQPDAALTRSPGDPGKTPRRRPYAVRSPIR
jgi:hypothetical protein